MQDYFQDIAYNTDMLQIENYQGHPLYVERKRIKNMYLRLNKDGSLKITCPYGTSENDIIHFLDEKQNWIEKAQQRLFLFKTDIKTGEDRKEAVWLGEHYQVKCIRAARSHMEMNPNTHSITYYLKNDTDDEIRHLFYTAGNRKLANMIAVRRGRLDQYICRDHQKPVPHITIRYTTSQWGSCTPAHNTISISSRLIHYPSGCLDYVLTHEYAHILVPNHSADFYKVVSKYMPDWKIYSDRLKTRNDYE